MYFSRQNGLVRNHATVRRFDDNLDPELIDVGDGWKLTYGNRGLRLATLTARYLRTSGVA
jgi:hypothetical protein